LTVDQVRYLRQRERVLWEVCSEKDSNIPSCEVCYRCEFLHITFLVLAGRFVYGKVIGEVGRVVMREVDQRGMKRAVCAVNDIDTGGTVGADGFGLPEIRRIDKLVTSQLRLPGRAAKYPKAETI
jgi:hypothetical protein